MSSFCWKARWMEGNLTITKHMHASPFLRKTSATRCLRSPIYNEEMVFFAGEKSESYSEKEQEDDAEVCEISFHGQLAMNYLLCDSSILNSMETSVLRKSVKSHQQFRCDGCDRAYTRMDSLKRHQAKCDASLEKLQEEVEWLHRQKFYCNQCGKGYKRLDTLRRHQRLVCGDKDNASTATDKPTV